jgi:hypothetical protein
MKLFLTLIVILTVSTTIYTYEESQTIDTVLKSFMDGKVKDLFRTWHLLFKKDYTLDSSEAKQRFIIFKDNLAKIKESNAQNLPYKLGLNQFSDLTNEEYRKLYVGNDKLPVDPAQNFLNDDDDDDLTKRNLQSNLPVNWTSMYSPIRNQGTCGSCWAFASAGTIEGNLAKKLNRTIPYLSPQQLVDCDKVSFGCNGGYYNYAFDYVRINGLQNEIDYPYKGIDSTCKFNSTKTKTFVTGYKYCNNGSYNLKCSISIVYGLLQQGPLTVSVDAAGYAFQYYKSGVMTADCSVANHAVILVGYGLDTTTNLNYWLIRNSWGSYWGDKGYIKIAVNDLNKNSCFVSNMAYLPLV